MILRCLLLVLIALGAASAAEAQLAFELRTGDSASNVQSMPVDSNACASQGPRAVYVGGVITNNGGATITDITASMSGLGNGFFLAGGQAATQAIGALRPGQSTGLYWFVGYGCTNGASSLPTIRIASSAGLLTPQVSLTARAAISANAGGNVLSSALGPGAVVGQTIWFDTAYDFAGSSVGDEYFLQPAGNQDFDAGCFRLVGTEIARSNIAGIPVGTRDRIYFRQSSKQSGNGYHADVRYYFEYLCAGASTLARPYSVQTSGGTNLKYTANYDGAGSIFITFPGAANPFMIAKSSDISRGVAGAKPLVKFTVTIANPSAVASRISGITDLLPAGASFVSLDPTSDVQAVNSSSIPAAGATGTLVFTGLQDQSWRIAAGGSVRLVYTVRMPAAEGVYVNSARASFGAASTPTVSASVTIFTPIPLTMIKSSRAAADPLNGATNPKLIPGGRAAYSLQIANPNDYPVTANTIAIVDRTPAGLGLFVGDAGVANGGPVTFEPQSSGLALTFSGLASTTDDVDFSNDQGASWNYTPLPNADGVDPAISHVRIRPRGEMAGLSSFGLGFAYLVR